MLLKIDTVANVTDITQFDKLLRGDENVAFADYGYTGVGKHPEHASCWAICQIGARRNTLVCPRLSGHWLKVDMSTAKSVRDTDRTTLSRIFQTRGGRPSAAGTPIRRVADVLGIAESLLTILSASTSRKVNCWDNSVMESFSRSLKSEREYLAHSASYQEA